MPGRQIEVVGIRANKERELTHLPELVTHTKIGQALEAERTARAGKHRGEHNAVALTKWISSGVGGHPCAKARDDASPFVAHQPTFGWYRASRRIASPIVEIRSTYAGLSYANQDCPRLRVRH